MRLLIKFPTRARPEKFFACLKSYVRLMSEGSEYKIAVSCDADDSAMNNFSTLNHLRQFSNLYFYFGDSKSKIEAINKDVDKHFDFDILLLASDDMFPQIEGYDAVIRSCMQKYFPNTDGVLWFYDGCQARVNTLVIMGRKYYERFGYIYHPSYKSLFCDNEFTDVSKSLKKYVYIDSVIIKHIHPLHNSGGTLDALYEKNESYWHEDEENYKKRYAIRWGLCT